MRSGRDVIFLLHCALSSALLGNILVSDCILSFRFDIEGEKFAKFFNQSYVFLLFSFVIIA